MIYFELLFHALEVTYFLQTKLSYNINQKLLNKRLGSDNNCVDNKYIHN